MDQLKQEINHRLNEIVSTVKEGKVKEAMLYSLLAPSKRLRPILFLTTLRSYQIDYHPYIDIACAIEMIHTYSLIHDDLPGMDNDDLRRGLPTCHKQFDEATAILAGDALLNLGVNVILDMSLDDSLKVKVLQCLYSASGVNGMIYGQQQDLYYEDKTATLNELEDIHLHKTGDLIRASVQLAAMIAHPEDEEIWIHFGYSLGLAFQIQDDLLDVLGDAKILGKKVGSDLDNNKSTYVTLLGIEESQKRVDDLFQKCCLDLYKLPINHGLLLDILQFLIKRVN